MIGPRPPFERILSLVDRKKLFSRALSAQQPMACKFADQTLLFFQPKFITPEGHLEGDLNRSLPVSVKSRAAIVFFYVGRERFFINSKLIRTVIGWKLANCTDFYKLNRRESFRVETPDNIAISFHVTQVTGFDQQTSQKCNVTARVTEFSSGGAKVRWFGSPALSKGATIKGQLVWLRGKEIPLQAVVKHQTRDGLFGLQFLGLDSVQNARLRMLSIELQQLVNFA